MDSQQEHFPTHDAEQRQALARLQEISLLMTVAVAGADYRCMRPYNTYEPGEYNTLAKERSGLMERIRTIRLEGYEHYLQRREGYAVAGWCDRHNYFRNRYDVYDTLAEAQAKIKELTTNPEWGIPTIIVRMIWTLDRTTEPTTLATCPVNQLGFAQMQELVSKHCCGVRGVRWNSLLYGIDGIQRTYTY